MAEALNAIGASVHAQTEKGMGGSRRQVFSLGYQRSREAGYKGVLWLEPEKDDLIRFVPRIIEPILRDEADISIPFRTKISWRSYPVFQVQSEKKGNEAIAQLTKRTGFEHFFGPVAYSAAATRYVIAMKPIEIGDGLIIDSYIPQYAPILAFRDGAVGSSVPIDFMYNPEQKYEEEVLIQDVMMMKRERQLWEMLQVCKKLAAMKREEQLIKCY